MEKCEEKCLELKKPRFETKHWLLLFVKITFFYYLSFYHAFTYSRPTFNVADKNQKFFFSLKTFFIETFQNFGISHNNSEGKMR